MRIKLLVLATLAAATCAFADEKPMNEHDGLYAEFNVGTNIYYLGVMSSVGSTTGSGIVGAGVNGAVGYYFSPILAAEAGYIEDYVDINRSDTIHVPYLAARFTADLGERFSMFAKLGLMVPSMPNVATLVLPYTGVGMAYAVNHDMDVNVQYQGAIYGLAGGGLLGVGLTYHFD